MKNNTLRKTINVDKPNLMTLWTLKQEDNVVLKLALFKEATPFNITGQTIRLGAKTLKGLKEQLDGFTIQENNLDIDLKNTILVPGLVEIDLEFTDVEGKMTSTSFFINVDSKVLNDAAVEATNEFSTFKRTVEEIEKDYQGLRKIVIDENNAANLQDQVNKVNSSLEQIAIIPTRINVETDDTNAIKRALLQGKKININKDYTISSNIELPSNIEIFGNGSITSTNINQDILLLKGADIEGNQCSNVKIKDIKLIGGRYGIQVYGLDNVYLPNNIYINNVATKDTQAGGIYLNSCYDIIVSNCKNNGGNRHIGVYAPISKPTITHNIKITNCNTINTKQFGYQTYYGKDITISNCYSDGKALISGDKSCITIDRSTDVIVTGNICKNAIESNIFITGAKNVTCDYNVCDGGKYGIQSCYNLEYEEDSSIGVSENIIINNNICTNQSITGIILNGVSNSVINGNSIKQPGNNAIYIMKSTRIEDSKLMDTNNITISNNISDSGYVNANVTNPTNLIGNIFSNYTGLQQNDMLLSQNYNIIEVANKTINNLGLLKKNNMSDSVRLAEFNLLGTTQKGMIWTYDYGTWNLRNSDNTVVISFNVGKSGDIGDLVINTVGKGLVVKSPDGNTKKRICINNTGDIITQTVS